MSLFDGILPEDSNIRGNVLDAVQALGMGMLQGDRNHFFGTNLAQNLAAVQAGNKAGMSREALQALLIQRGFSPEDAKKFSANEAIAKLAIEGKESDDTKRDYSSYRGGGAGGGVSNLGMGASPAAPGGPAAGASLNGGLTPPTGTAGEIKDRFIGTLKDGGLTNPYGLAVAAAYGQHESGYDPSKIVGSWPDPSQSGQPGTSGGLLSWRADRLDNMRASTAGAKDPVAAQGQFFLNENPQVTAALQNAKSLPEANEILAKAWKFAGYDKPGVGEYAKRLATAQSYLPQIGKSSTQVADATGTAPVSPVTRSDLPPVGAGAQKAADAAADMPVPGAQPAGFNIPPAPSAQGGPSYTPDTTTARAIAIRQQAQKDADQARVQRGLDFIARHGESKTGKAMAESIKLELQPLLKNMEKTEAEKLLSASGIDPNSKQGRDMLLGAIPGNAPTPAEKETGYLLANPQNEDTYMKVKRAGAQTEAQPFDKEADKLNATRLGSMRDAGDKSAATVGDLRQLRALSQVIGDPGQGAKLQAALGPYLTAFNIDSKGLTPLQQYNSIIQKLAPQQHVPGSGPQSDIEFKGALAAMGDPTMTSGARASIIDGLEATHQYNIKRGQIADAALNKEITPSDASKQIRALGDPLQAFKDYKKAHPEEFPGSAPANGGQGSTAPAQSGRASEAPAQPLSATEKTSQDATIKNAQAYVAKYPEKREALRKALEAQFGRPIDGL